MSEGLFENHGDAPGQAPHWDHPDGLGWHLWRRAHSTGLLAQPIQRDLGRFRSHTLIDRAPLADDIRRRWGLGQEPAGYRFPLDLPLFYTRFPRYDASPSEAQSSSTVQLLRRSTAAPSLSMLSRRLPLSEGLGLSQTMPLERLVSRSGGIDIASAWHGRDLPNPGQTPRLLWHRQEARTPGVATTVATDNNVRASAQAGPRTVGGTQQSAQRLVQRNILASGSIHAPSDLKTFTLTATASPSPGRVPDGALIPHRAMGVLRTALPSPVWPEAFSTAAPPLLRLSPGPAWPRSVQVAQPPTLQRREELALSAWPPLLRLSPGPAWPRSVQVAQPPTLQRREELALPAWPLERRSGPFAAPYGLSGEPFARLRPSVSREGARTVPGLASSGARPASWVALPFQAAGRGDTPHAAGATSPSPGRVPDGALIPHRAMGVLRTALPSPVWPEAFSTAAPPLLRLSPGPAWPRSVQVAQPPTLQRREELALPAWPLERRSGPFAAPYGLSGEPFARLRPSVSREGARTVPGLASSGARPASWVALPFQAAGRGDTPHAAGATSPSPGRVPDGALIPHRAMGVLRTALPSPVWPEAFSTAAPPLLRLSPGPAWPRSVQVAQPPTLQRREELALPAWPLERRSGPFAAPYGLSGEPFARLRPSVSREGARTVPGLASSGARPASWVALPFQAAGRGDTPHAAGAAFPQVAEVSVQRRASLVTQPASLVTQRGIGVSHMQLVRSQTGLDDMGTAASLPLGLTNPGAAPEAALLARNIPWKHLAGSHNTAAIADHGTPQRTMGVEGRTGLLRRSNTREETSGHSGDMVTTDLMWRRRTSGAAATGRPLLSDASQVAAISVSRQENPAQLQRDAGPPPASWTRSQSRVDNMGIVASMPLLLIPLAAGTPVGMLSRTPFWKHHAGGPNPASTAFTVTRQRGMDFGEVQRPLYWSGALQAPDQHRVGRGGEGCGKRWPLAPHRLSHLPSDSYSVEQQEHGMPLMAVMRYQGRVGRYQRKLGSLCIASLMPTMQRCMDSMTVWVPGLEIGLATLAHRLELCLSCRHIKTAKRVCSGPTRLWGYP